MKTLWERLKLVLITIITISIPIGLIFLLGNSIKEISNVIVEIKVATGKLSWLAGYPVSREGALTIQQNLGILSHTKEYLFFDAIFTGIIFLLIAGSEYLLISSVGKKDDES